VSLSARTTPDDVTVYVDRDAAERGADGPFFVAYCSPDRGRRWGYLCGNCDTFDNAMDAMGRIECNACGNYRKPDRWDAAHE
jgi:hypothetical protein